MAKRTELQKILDRDEIQKDLDSLIEANPEHIITAYMNPETGKVVTKWYGQWTQCKGMLEILNIDMLDWLKKEDG